MWDNAPAEAGRRGKEAVGRGAPADDSLSAAVSGGRQPILTTSPWSQRFVVPTGYHTLLLVT